MSLYRVGLDMLGLTIELYHRDVIVQIAGVEVRMITGKSKLISDCNSASYILHFQKRRDGHQPDREDVHLEVGVELGVRVNIPLTEADLQKYHFGLISSLRELLRLSLWLFDKCCSLHLKTYPQLLWSVLVDAVGGSQEVRVV